MAAQSTVQLAYTIGVEDPVSVYIDTNGTGMVEDAIISKEVSEVFDNRPAMIIVNLGLRDWKFSYETNYGHFGQSSFPWERLDKVEELQNRIMRRDL